MPVAQIGDARIFYRLEGTGEIPLVLVHGSWVSHHSWDPVVPDLARNFRVIAYDRRGYDKTPRIAGQGSIRENVADLAALIEHLGLAPAWVVGNSFGAVIALQLAVERPDLFRGLIGHEPPMFSLLADNPALAPLFEETCHRVAAVVNRIARHDHSGAAKQFIETLAFGPGKWSKLSPEAQRSCTQYALAFLDEAQTEHPAFNPGWHGRFTHPVLLTRGSQSPPAFAPVIARLATLLPNVEVVTIPMAGHIPHATHPKTFIEIINSFIAKK